MGLWSNPSGTGHVGKAVVATDPASVNADQDNGIAAFPNQGGGRWQGRDEHRRVAKLAPRPERGAVPGTGREPYGGAAPPAPPCAEKHVRDLLERQRLQDGPPPPELEEQPLPGGRALPATGKVA
jgi:hypothetical protein